MLKIFLRNIGPIYAYDFDLSKSIHLIYGKNNIGKSHAISIIYLILKNLKDQDENLLKKSAGTQIWEKTFLAPLKKSIYTLFQSMDNFKNKFNLSEKTLIKITFEGFNVEIGFDKDFFISDLSISEPKKIGFNMLREISELIPQLYFLPASRSGLYQGLGAFAPLLAKISQAKMYVKNLDIAIPTLSEPVSDYFLALSTISQHKSSENIILQDIVNDIEKNIIKAKIHYNEAKNKIEYIDETLQLRLDITQTSSMVAEVAPIVIFLKYIISKIEIAEDIFVKNILFIEEPEAHLHPSVQVEMMRIFVKLATQNVHIVMTTHSDFMFNELTNLLLADKIKPEKVASVHLVMTEKGSLDKGDMQATAQGIEDFNFSEVAEAMYEERLKLLENRNQQNGDYVIQ